MVKVTRQTRRACVALPALAVLVSLIGVSFVREGSASGGRAERSATRHSSAPIVTEVAQRRRIRVLLSYRRAGLEKLQARLQIFRFGRRLVDDRLLPLCSHCAVVPGGLWGPPSLAIRDLDGDGDLEVLVELGLGGAHNVPYTYIYSYQHPSWFSSSGTFDRLVHIWGNFGASRQDLDRDGRLEFVSHDPRFFGRFACSACSAGPMQIWRFQREHLLDVTLRFPAAIRRDLALYRACLPDRAPRGKDERGCLPAWAGNEALLGRSRVIWPVLEAARKNGNLGGLGDVIVSPRGRAYVAELRSFLRQTGYVR